MQSIQFISGDMIKVLSQFSDKRVLLMNMANREHPGGFNYIYGKSILMGQEEKLCANSDLKNHLKQLNYPLTFEKLNVCKGVQFNNNVKCDVAVCCAPKHSLNLVMRDGKQYDEMTNLEIEQIRKQIRLFNKAGKNYDVVIASALGCGYFNNDPRVVSQIFKEECKDIQTLIFCIYSEGHSQDNYSIFKKTLMVSQDICSWPL